MKSGAVRIASGGASVMLPGSSRHEVFTFTCSASGTDVNQL